MMCADHDHAAHRSQGVQTERCITNKHTPTHIDRKENHFWSLSVLRRADRKSAGVSPSKGESSGWSSGMIIEPSSSNPEWFTRKKKEGEIQEEEKRKMQTIGLR